MCYLANLSLTEPADVACATLDSGCIRGVAGAMLFSSRSCFAVCCAMHRCDKFLACVMFRGRIDQGPLRADSARIEIIRSHPLGTAECQQRTFPEVQ